MNIVIALRDQQFQMKRLLEMQLWASAAPKATLDEIEAQILATKATLAALEQLIIEQKARSAPPTRSVSAVSPKGVSVSLKASPPSIK
jgi:hypothetical protein